VHSFGGRSQRTIAPKECRSRRLGGYDSVQRRAQIIPTTANAVRGVAMTLFRVNARRVVTIFLIVGAAIFGLYGVALLAAALRGSSTPSSVLFVGFGFTLLVVSVILLAFVLLNWMEEKSHHD
jgi:uncharacterized membrane protein